MKGGSKRPSRRGQLYRFALAPTTDDLDAAAKRAEIEAFSPMRAVEDLLTQAENIARGRLSTLGEAPDNTPEAVRDSSEPDTELRFVAQMLMRVRDGRQGVHTVQEAQGFLLGYNVAMAWAIWRIEWLLGANIDRGRISARVNADRRERSGHVRGRAAAATRRRWVEMDAALGRPRLSKTRRADLIAQKLGPDHEDWRKPGTIAPHLPPRQK